MPKTLVNCPNCKRPIQADLRQLFDAGEDAGAKQILLSGAFNIVQCPLCGFHGNLATPIVYHDPQKELLLTFVPPEIGLPQNEQERAIGSLINQVMNKLPQEKRKAYLLQPQAALTMQGLVERILEADGITREMLQAQQQRMSLIQRLANAATDVRAEIIKQEESRFDAELFGLLDRLIETSSLSGDQESEQRLKDLHTYLLEATPFGRQLAAQIQEVQAAIESLKEAGKELTREKLLDLVIKAPNDTRLRALVSLARPGMDYVFFQMLTERIDRARAEGRTRLAQLRESLLNMTSEIDRTVEARLKLARELLNKILESDNIGEATLKNISTIDEFFLQELTRSLEEEKKQGNLEKASKLQQVVEAIQQASSATQALAFIEALLETPDDAERQKLLLENKDLITPEFLNTLSSLVYQVQSNNDVQMSEKFKSLHRQVLRFSMEKNLKA
jgi:hypothetical protein